MGLVYGYLPSNNSCVMLIFNHNNYYYLIVILVFKYSLVAQMVKNLPAMWETRVWILGWEDPLEKGMKTHSSILAWRIPWTEGNWQASPQGRKVSDETEWLTLTLSLSYIYIILFNFALNIWLYFIYLNGIE